MCVCRRTSQSSTCVLQNQSLQGCTRGAMAQGLGRPAAVSIRTHVCCRATQSKAPPKDHGQGVKGSRGTRVWPTRCCCEHAHTNQKNVLQDKSAQGCTQGSKVTRVWQIICCGEHTHARRRMRQLSAVVSTHTHVYTLQENQFWLGFADRALL